MIFRPVYTGMFSVSLCLTAEGKVNNEPQFNSPQELYDISFQKYFYTIFDSFEFNY
ncbi:MAG: hypothetical protein ACOCP8_08995 [archaeon]